MFLQMSSIENYMAITIMDSNGAVEAQRKSMIVASSTEQV